MATAVGAKLVEKVEAEKPRRRRDGPPVAPKELIPKEVLEQKDTKVVQFD